MDAHRACLYLRTLQAIRASGRKGVPAHRASQYVGTDARSAARRSDLGEGETVTTGDIV